MILSLSDQSLNMSLNVESPTVHDSQTSEDARAILELQSDQFAATNSCASFVEEQPDHVLFAKYLTRTSDSLPTDDEIEYNAYKDSLLSVNSATKNDVPNSELLKRQSDALDDKECEVARKRLKITEIVANHRHSSRGASPAQLSKLALVVDKFLYVDVKEDTPEQIADEIRQVLLDHGGGSHILLRRVVPSFPIDTGIARGALVYGARSKPQGCWFLFAALIFHLTTQP